RSCPRWLPWPPGPARCRGGSGTTGARSTGGSRRGRRTASRTTPGRRRGSRRRPRRGSRARRGGRPGRRTWTGRSAWTSRSPPPARSRGVARGALGGRGRRRSRIEPELGVAPDEEVDEAPQEEEAIERRHGDPPAEDVDVLRLPGPDLGDDPAAPPVAHGVDGGRPAGRPPAPGLPGPSKRHGHQVSPDIHAGGLEAEVAEPPPLPHQVDP